MNAKKGIPFDGFGNVIAMLQAADAPFREKLLRNIAARDPELAERLLSAVNIAIADARLERSQRELRRSTNASNVRGYGTIK